MYPTLLFSLKVSDMLRSFYSPINLCAPLIGESKGGVGSTSAGMIGESNRACIIGESNRSDAIDAGRNGETSECSTLSIPSNYYSHCFRQFDQKDTPSMDTACKSVNHSSKDAANESQDTTGSCTATTQSDPFDSQNTTTSSGSTVSSTKLTIMPGPVGSRASGTSIAGIDRMMLLRKDVLSSSETFCHRTSIFEKTEKKIHSTSTFFFYNYFFFLIKFCCLLRDYFVVACCTLLF